jgi:chorismate dehydratase
MRLSAVSYLNTKPFIYGIYKSDLADHIELSLDIPSVCAQKLLDGTADAALTPVAIIPSLPQAYIISDYCIGAVGAVQTVCLYSQTPLEDIKAVYLDFHSKTSVALTRILFQHYWGLSPDFIPAEPGFEEKITGETAGLIIGDRAIQFAPKFKYAYDLGTAWTNWTGLPFVFAAWVSVRPLKPEFIVRFNEALKTGLDHIPELIKILPTFPDFDLEAYYRDNISYRLDDKKWTALQLFLSYIAGENGFHVTRNHY